MSFSLSASTLQDCPWLPLSKLQGASVLVTGGTGLVGYAILLELSKLSDILDLKLYALVRNRENAEKVFSPFLDRVSLVVGDVRDDISLEEPLDYIIHGASITASQMFVQQPVETIMTSIAGTRNMLELARRKNIRSMVYLSSMEVYGTPTGDRLICEKDVGYLDPIAIRSSYPESKRMSETLCAAYAKEYGVPVKIARLAQTFGPNAHYGDKRAVVQFITSALRQQDIEIKASGDSSRMYLYTFDAVSALLTLLLKGQDGHAYNVANRNSYCSIRQLAERITHLLSSRSRVLVNTGTEQERSIYPPDSFLRLDTSKLENLGWLPYVSLEDSLRFMAAALRESTACVTADEIG